MKLMGDLGAFLPTILASAFGGGLVAGAFGVYNRLASNKDEHAKWLRNQKTEAYGHYVGLAQALIVACSGYRGGQMSREDTFASFSAAQLGTLELLAPRPVRQAAKELEEVCDQIFHAVLYDNSLDERAAFRAAIDSYNERKQKFLSLAADDLDVTVADYAVSGSQEKG